LEKLKKPAVLALADGTVFKGTAIGVTGETSGEIVFNTSMTGYQEILTDPSYANQILTFTYPHIGNVGVNSEDIESNSVHVSGLIVRTLSEHYSNYRAEGSLQDYLVDNKVVGISNIDTRALVLHLRDNGAQMGVVDSSGATVDELVDKAKALPSIEGQDLVQQVTTDVVYRWTEGVWKPGGAGYRKYTEVQLSSRPHIVALDLGIKFNILRLLIDQGFRVTVVPANTKTAEIVALKPNGIFISNGPGDPAAVKYSIETVKQLVGKYPIFGICLGHQVLGLSLGAHYLIRYLRS